MPTDLSQKLMQSPLDNREAMGGLQKGPLTIPKIKSPLKTSPRSGITIKFGDVEWAEFESESKLFGADSPRTLLRELAIAWTRQQQEIRETSSADTEQEQTEQTELTNPEAQQQAEPQPVRRRKPSTKRKAAAAS